MKVRRHYENVPGAYAIRRSRETTQPDGDLRKAASKQGAVVVEPQDEEPKKEG
jgi:hypothetical protein